MTPLLLLADAVAPPADLATWIGSLVLTALGTALVGRFFRGTDQAAAAAAKADAEWRAEVRGDLKQLITGQTNLTYAQGLQAKDISAVQGQLGALEKRQEAQAAAHLAVVTGLRNEFDAKLQAAMATRTGGAS